MEIVKQDSGPMIRVAPGVLIGAELAKNLPELRRFCEERGIEIDLSRYTPDAWRASVEQQLREIPGIGITCQS